MNWQDIKLATLQKMFSAEGTEIVNDESNRDYLAAMPFVANEALNLLSTSAKFIVKSIEIAHNPVENLLGNEREVFDHDGSETGPLTFTASGAKSYSFEVTGEATATIYVNDVLLKTVTIPDSNFYVEYKGLISNPDKEEVRLEFNSDYPIAVKNVALYAATFKTDSAVQSFSAVLKYNMKTLVNDFYKLHGEIYFEGSQALFKQTNSYFVEAGKLLVLDRETKGNYTIYYDAYPAEITSSTADEYELPLDAEIASLLPMYMASQLYKDDDNGIATSYRNEFEVARSAIASPEAGPSAETFESESGWY